MKKIIIIGSNGKIGNRLVKELGSNNIIYTDEKKTLNNLINKDFINSKKIDAIINCCFFRCRYRKCVVKIFIFGNYFITF